MPVLLSFWGQVQRQPPELRFFRPETPVSRLCGPIVVPSFEAAVRIEEAVRTATVARPVRLCCPEWKRRATMETRSKSVTSEEARQLNRAVRARKGRGLESGEARAATVKDAASGAALLRSERPVMSGRSTASGQGADVRALQRLAGNRAVCDLLSVGQSKLEVGPAGDRYEEEADDVARRVVGSLQEANRSDAPPVDDDLQHDSTALVGRATQDRPGDGARH